MQEMEGQIRERAYHIWLANGCAGEPEQHWFAAEREMLAGGETPDASHALPARRSAAKGKVPRPRKSAKAA